MLLKYIPPVIQQHMRQISSSSAAVTRIHRSIYARQYPTVVVLPDGSTVNIRYEEPRKIVKLPLDLSTLTEAERKARLEARKPRRKINIVEEVEDNFNAKKYMKYIKKK
ncbi:large ribosomal subunit protein mL55 [Stomoxys calcitrans]|uniref:39S ribosomal protein L55, mitochondrial n=1 Tax=Stomoxys calcitrans TaxID=35570 RepID=A0A1I8QBY2_STOCA|nr:large ribosomal subunit protein mL55 [Stomoxys calcitrans]